MSMNIKRNLNKITQIVIANVVYIPKQRVSNGLLCSPRVELHRHDWYRYNKNKQTAFHILRRNHTGQSPRPARNKNVDTFIQNSTEKEAQTAKNPRFLVKKAEASRSAVLLPPHLDPTPGFPKSAQFPHVHTCHRPSPEKNKTDAAVP